ncbi:MAG: 50S ribosomal protein L4 [Candidatus Kapabacteria bacterium]|nr:50S ribosomal protein L4 [Candidatus Kapabacteria bacterium]MCS7169472.1 50S ribosomal protein L4 [Candidatus Kapabacteria bacterium]MDW7997229.1 50S ribosomal protein L4 [Bacteroidota bacterium]MDW8224712.1 50S ribosomal protein L4 [Bacteroidota bacterium]
MMLVDLWDKTGSIVGQVELPDALFGIEPHEHALYLAVRAHLANRRQGTHAVRTRSEVRGGGRKPWSQKGTGRSRHGSVRSPIWVGGGKIHGPQPRDYTMELPQKVKRLARKSALSLRAREGNLLVVQDFTLERIQTKLMVQVLRNLALENVKTLVLLPGIDHTIVRSARNLPYVTTMLADKASAYHILAHTKLLLFQGAIAPLVASFGEEVSYVADH